MSIGVLVYMHGWFDTSQFISWCSHGNCEMLGYSCCGHWRDGGHESCCDWLAGWSQKMYWLVVDLPLYMEIYGSVYSQYIENKIYVLQWIGFVGKIYWFKPHISWENLWFPVQIFPTKPIQKDVLFNPDWGDDLKKDSLKYSHQFQASATGSGFIYIYIILE